MKQTFCIGLCLLALLGSGGRLKADILTAIEYAPDGAPFNLQSERGAPISTITNTPPGSDGRMPTTLTWWNNNPPATVTANQFQGLLSFGGVTAATNWMVLSNAALSGQAPFSQPVALAMQLPMGQVNNGGLDYIIQRRVQIGAPFMSRQVSFPFGGVIPPPVTDISGSLLANTTAGYWQGAPWPDITNALTSSANLESYYYSPNAGRVFATQPGPITVTWVTLGSFPGNGDANWLNYTNLLAPIGTPSFYTNAGSIYRLYSANYVVSSSPVQPPHYIYWTEGGFGGLGYPVSLAQGRVSDIHVAYNGSFPPTLATPYQDPNGGGTNTEIRTLWLEGGGIGGSAQQIHAFNVQGQVFVELLGQPVAGGTARQYLGFEIIQVYEAAAPANVTINLGERLTPYQDGWEGLNPPPSPIQNSLGTQFYYQLSTANGVELYADKYTPDLNDLQVYWLTAGVAGVLWPDRLVRYSLVWPADATQFSHYLRSPASSQAQASLTAVPLDTGEAPSLDYQDPLDQIRGFLTPNGAFYTWLTPSEPAHRALLRFNANGHVRFERVFSWLDAGIATNGLLAGSVATSLSAWNPTNSALIFSNLFAAPYETNLTVFVGDRIEAPPNELGNTGNYWAGWINPTIGASFNPGAYLDPFANGFTAANKGAIIPVNAIPGNNQLQVWWFRQNNANPAQGFRPVYWPSVIGNYALEWPVAAPQIIMAANVGTGALDPTVAQGRIYYQNDPTLPGYNPNEEHAIMTGGAAYALADDLNVTNANNPSLPFNGYSSAPYVLIDYLADDGRPDMAVFQVRREAPELGIVFDYPVPAGTVLQPPSPLWLPALAPLAGGRNFNTAPTATSGDLPPGWSDNFTNSPYAAYRSFTFQDRQHQFWVYRGPHAGLPALQSGSYDTNGNFSPNLPPGTALVGSNYTYYLHVSRNLDTLFITNDPATPLPPGLALGGPLQGHPYGLVLTGAPTSSGSYTISIIVSDVADTLDNGVSYNSVTNQLVLQVITNGTPFAQGPLAITSSNQYSAAVITYSNRPPYLALAPVATNSFTMQFYYKTQPGFAWPGYPNPPAAGSIVPFLAPLGPSGLSADPTSSNTASLNIVYRPYWAEVDASGNYTPTLNTGQTLTKSVKGLAGVRGQDSVQVLYQESIATNIANNIGQPPVSASVTLFDPTVEKKSSLAPYNITTRNGLPGSVVASSFQGLFFFPNLPPNLVSRFWFNPNSTNLVLQGQFNTDDPNNNYLLLNVLTAADLAAINALCSSSDPTYTAWTQAVAGLSVNLFTYDRSNSYSLYQKDTNLTVKYFATNVVAVTSPDSAVDSYALSAMGPGGGFVSYMAGNSLNPAYAADPVTMYVVRVKAPLFPGALVAVNVANASPLSQLFTVQHTADLAGDTSDYEYDWRIIQPVNGVAPLYGSQQQINWPSANGSGPTFTLGATGVQGLGDNYISVRYRCANPLANPAVTNWSAFTDPVLVPGWIARVLAAINPFNQETTDFYNNAVNTSASIISAAGARWTGDVPLNQASLTNSGLIQIYQTLLDVGKSLSIEAAPPINNGPANDALLLASGYLNDLYMTLGNDAWANSLNPTIGFGTSDQTYGAIATSQFVFEGEEPTLLAQNLALLRGRDDSLSPGVDLYPVYNHLYWNYTYGIDAGQVIYALNYNITDLNGDGVVNAQDAAILFPQGHGDAYGHYMTALTGYYGLLLNPYFDWVPHSEAVSVLGATVQVNYQDERKFASAAAALARAGRQVFDLTWREDYQPGTAGGWNYFATNYTGQFSYTTVASKTQPITRYWGMDHWAARVGQGAYLNWVVGSAILPAKDTNPNDQGIQIVDRTTVPELQELPATAAALENDLDNANAGFTPLGLSQNSIPFDINPQQVTGANPQTHFEQIYARAVQALNNAVVAFNDAQNVTQEMRQEQNSASDFAATVTAQELAFNNQLIEIYGAPYPDDIGPGGFYPQGYTGPDLQDYMYVDSTSTNTYGGNLPDPSALSTNYLFVGSIPASWLANVYANFNFFTNDASEVYNQNTNYVAYVLGPDGYIKPASWTSERLTPGSIQTAITAVDEARDKLRIALASTVSDKQNLDRAFAVFQAQTLINQNNLALGQSITATNQYINDVQEGYNIFDAWVNVLTGLNEDAIQLGEQGDVNLIAEISNKLFAGILTSANFVLRTGDAIYFTVAQALINTAQNSALDMAQSMAANNYTLGQQNAVNALASQFQALSGDYATINQDQQALSDAQTALKRQLSSGLAVQAQRATFRQHAAAIVQGYRTQDAAFLIFQNEKLQRYTTLFNLAAQYAYMAANAYDYETGLLQTPAGLRFLNQIISSSALGVVENGQPQISGTATGDPGLANALAEMYADWSVLKGRLGFNNPDGYGTTVSLRQENYRIKPDPTGDNNWQQVLQQGLMPDLLADTDVKEHCLQIDDGSGAAVPGIVLTFSTTIRDGQNLFGQPLGLGDHDFSSSSFATKIFSLGVDLDGYVGMDNPVANGASSPDPSLELAATPYVYLIPCGQDSMRSPPLGDTSAVRSWSVNDVAIPLPFNIGASDFSATPFCTSANSLSEPLFASRKQQAFRPVSTLAAFSPDIYGAAGALRPSQFSNERLIGRSVWNSKWKLIIPGKTLLADPNQGLARFLKSVKDIHLYFITYSYSGN